MKNDMNIIHILFGIVLILLVLIQTYNSVKAESHRQELQQLCDFLQSRKDTMDSLLNRFDSILSDMASDNERNAVLKNHARELESLVWQLEYKRNGLESTNKSLENTQNRLYRSREQLFAEVNKLREEIQHGKDTLWHLENRTDSLNGIRTGLEIAINDMPAEEIHYLSNSLYSIGMTPSVRRHIEAEGIRFIGDLISVNENYLTDIWGLGPVNLERIKKKLQENGVWFGMDAVRVNNHWFRVKREPITEHMPESQEQIAEQSQESTQEQTTE